MHKTGSGGTRGSGRSHSLLRILPMREGTKFPLLLAILYVLFDERLVIECPFDILRLDHKQARNLRWPSEVFQAQFYRGERVLTT